MNTSEKDEIMEEILKLLQEIRELRKLIKEKRKTMKQLKDLLIKKQNYALFN